MGFFISLAMLVLICLTLIHVYRYSLSDSSLATAFSILLILLIGSHCKICGVETKIMFIHTRSSTFRMFAKFGWQTRTFCHKKWKKRLPNSSQTDYSHCCPMRMHSSIYFNPFASKTNIMVYCYGHIF